MQAPPELLGAFYLGAEYDLGAGRRTETAIHYDARDLTTHAICVGMTGSGKTGLCLSLLEEAAIDGVPALIVDPKGGMTNLLLHFPELRAEDFEPWVNPDDARRQGQTVPAYAAAIASRWRDGLADWGIGPDRMRRLGEAADFAIYTPGSDAGLPISIMGSLAAPGLDFEAHAEALRARISGTVAALLGLVGVKADPVRSRESILLANIFEHFWRQNQDLDLAALILAIQNPPVRQLGVFEVDTFYPEKERFELAMAFNNLLAAPSFQSWLEGETLDVERLLYTEEGQPRHSIFYLAHLSESERMFFVTLLLENVVTWMRRQTGTTSLRALLYFDEIFGFFPATSEPPSKRPLLTLLKQARAFGLGCILAAQNPIDIDYKGLTNAGTWFIGKLQAQRDKERVLHGLRGAIAEAGGGGRRADYDALIGQLRGRLFLMHNIHQERPVVMQTRWAMSYLRGPLTQPQIRKLVAGRKPAVTTPEPISPTPPHPHTSTSPHPHPPPAVPAPAAPAGFATAPPSLAPSVPQVYLPLTLDQGTALQQLAQETGQRPKVERVALVCEPAILGGTSVRFVDRKRDINEQVEQVLLAPVPDDLGGVDWEMAEALPLRLDELASSRPLAASEQGPFFAPVPQAANSARELADIARGLADWLYYHSRLALTAHPELGVTQHPGERERSFKARLRQAARERRDAEVDRLTQKYAARIERLEARLRKQERELVADEAEYQARKSEARLTLGETALSFFMGRRRTRAVSTVATKRRLADKAKLEVEETREEIADLEEEIAALEAELQAATQEITRKWADLLDELTTESVHPRRTDVDVRLVALAWLPSWLVTYNDGMRTHTTTIAAYPAPFGGAHDKPFGGAHDKPFGGAHDKPFGGAHDKPFGGAHSVPETR
jgi:hypothetical protein